MRRLLNLTGAALLALGVLASASADAQTVRDHRQQSRPQPPVVRDHRQPPQAQTPAEPAVRDHRNNARFVVAGVSLYANDETGPDYVGSDEIMVVYDDRIGRQHLETSVFGDFDTGERRAFARSQSCITPTEGTNRTDAWRCQGGGAAGPVNVGVTVLEVDDWLANICAYGRAGELLSGGRVSNPCRADVVGRNTIALSREFLLAELQHVGATKNFNLRIGGYTLTYRVQRVANAQ